MGYGYQYEDLDYNKLSKTTAKSLARLILNVLERDEIDYFEQLDIIENICKNVRKRRQTKSKGKKK